MQYTLMTLAERPELEAQIAALRAEVWSAFLLKDSITNQFLERVLHHSPQYQLIICNEVCQVVAFGLSVPFTWNGVVQEIPEGLAAVIRQSAFECEQKRQPNSLAAISVVVAPPLRNQGLSSQLLQALRQLASTHGLSKLVVPVRPSLKHRYPLIPIEEYAFWTREDGLPFDPWIRTHARLGARILKIAPRSIVITGTVQEWEEWTGMRLPQSGSYILPGALVPLTISYELNEGRYEDPEIWMEHIVSEDGH